MKTFQIFWHDLTEEAQERLQELYDDNYSDVIPIATIDIEYDEEE